ncbi:MAG: apolipoprotein N-acyltransferase [Bacteroidales bacterium]|nr:apolipoprotein N-acyltransferase [Bacteroidales bacterium]MDD4058357.1 apolipoprotein N-acyltransferase [Bacteroidales bacterium]
MNGEIMHFTINKKTKIIFRLVLAAVLLLSLPFLFKGFGILILFAFVPILMLQNYIETNGVKYGWSIIFSTFLLWTIATTYWIGYANFKGAVASMVLYSLSLTVLILLYGWFKRRLGRVLGYTFLILGWLAWEHLMAQGELNWPWLALGNAFASLHKVVQWYEFTGVAGGTLWALIVSLLAYDIIVSRRNCAAPQMRAKNIILITFIILPIFLSHALYITYKEEENSARFLMLQPNIDPYHEKFGGMTQKEQDEILIDLFNEGYDNSVDFIIAPETFTSGIIENNPYESDSFSRIASLAKGMGSSKLIVGASTHYIYPIDEYPAYKKPSPSSRRIGEGWYDSHNSAIMIDSSGAYQFYYKSKLVPLVEYMPFQKYLSGLRMFVIELGGYFGSYGSQDKRTLFKSNDENISIGTAICYESVYGYFFREFVLEGANVMSIITNDGWWLDSPGYKQHLWFDQLRSIETRRSIVRCGNTGISALIDQRGDIVSQTKWWSKEWLKGDVNLNDKVTTFVKYGDFVGRIAYYSMLIFIALALFALVKTSEKVKR